MFIFALSNNKTMSKKLLKKSDAQMIRKSLGNMRECLSESINDFNEKQTVNIRFSKVGKKYRVEESIMLPTDKIGLKLQKSFNELMNNIEVKHSGIKVEGLMTIGTNVDMFHIGYNDHVNKDGVIVKQGHSIDAIL